MKTIIIGGGAAGIAAAYTILQAQSSATVELFEARSTYGGRAHTDRSIKGFAFDMGAQYIQDPTQNPWTGIAKTMKLDTIEEQTAYLLRTDRTGNWQDEPTTTHDVQQLVNAIEVAYKEARLHPNAVIAAKPGSPSQAELFSYATSAYGPFTESAEIWQYVAADRERVASEDGHNNLFVEQGLGTLVQTYGSRLSKEYADRFVEHLDTPVSEIFQDARQVTVKSKNGKITSSADTCIVTIPTSVIAAGNVQFTPALPLEMKLAFKVLRLGSYKKVAMEMSKEPVGIAVNTNYYLIEIDPEGVWQYYRLSHRPDVLVAHAAGDFAAKLDQMRDADVFNLLKQRLSDAYPAERLVFSGGKALTNWSNDLYAQGAYSYTAYIGGGPDDKTSLDARRQISKPVGRVYFAGEANSINNYATIAGAYESGVAAVQRSM